MDYARNVKKTDMPRKALCLSCNTCAASNAPDDLFELQAGTILRMQAP